MYTASTLVAAVATGDITTLEACFQDPALLDLVAETERSFMGERRTHSTWFSLSLKRPLKSVFTVAVLEDQVEVLRWLFAPERVALMPSTLGFELPLVASEAFSAKKAEARELLLTISESGLFRVRWGERWSDLFMTDTVVNCEEDLSAKMLRIVLAHGGIQVSGALLSRCVESESQEVLEFAIAEGACVVGTPLDYGSRFGFEQDKRTSRSLALGMDPRGTGLVDAAYKGRLHDVVAFITEGCVDVDGGNFRGLTPLLALVSASPWLYDADELLRVTRLLLDTGADVNRANRDGETPLFLAMRSDTTGEEPTPFVAMVELLLQYGADPNALVKTPAAAEAERPWGFH